jgi:hypothetical protein
MAGRKPFLSFQKIYGILSGKNDISKVRSGFLEKWRKLR